MFTLNRIELIGRTGADARSVPNGPTTLSLATNATWTDQKGARQERVDWHSLTVWGSLSKYAATLPKGTPLWVEGELVYDKYNRTVDVQQGTTTVQVEVPTTSAKIRVTRIIRLDSASNAEPDGTPA